MSLRSREIKGISVLYLLAIVGTILANSTFVLKDITHVLKDVSPALQSTSHDTKEIYFLWFDFFPALFLFLNGLTFSIAFKNKRMSTSRMSGYYSRRGLVLMVLGFITSGIWPMNILYIAGLCYFTAPVLARLDRRILEVASVLIVVIGSFAGNLDFPIYPQFETLELSNGVVRNLIGFIFFNGYYSFLPWVAFFTLGMSIGKGDMRIRGWFPPVSILALILIVIGAVLESFLVKIYGEIPNMGIFRFQFLEVRLHSLSFAFIVAGLCIVLTHAGNFYMKKMFSHAWIQKIWHPINQFSSAKYTLYFLVVCETMIIFSVVKYGDHPIFWFRPAYVLIPMSLVLLFGSFFLTKWWTKRVHENTPVEWLLKKIAGSKK
jgi:uncharacterized protein